MTHYVYRYFDADDRLIYIGCSKNPWTRYKTHRQDNPHWIGEVKRGRISVFPDMASALKAEKAAILTEAPLYNRTPARWPMRGTWSREDYLHYAEGWLGSARDPYAEYKSPHMVAVREVYAALFGEALPVRPNQLRSAA